MKEEFDLSHYLNLGKEPKEQQTLSAIVGKIVANQQEKRTKQSEQSQQSESTKLSSISKQTLPPEHLHEEKDKQKAEQSEQEKQQAVSCIPNHQQ